MAKIKSYTDIEQSNILAEILPIESADMYYMEASPNNYTIGVLQRMERDMLLNQSEYYKMFPCWSLTALLIVIPNYKLSSEHNYHTCTAGTSFGDETVGWFDSPVDACVAMIEKLHNLKMLKL